MGKKKEQGPPFDAQAVLAVARIQPPSAENHGYYLPFFWKRSGDELSARLARLIWRTTGLPHDNGKFSGVSLWWSDGKLKGRLVYFNFFKGEYEQKDLT